MTKTITAIYEGGILRPVEPLPLAEGECVDVTIDSTTVEERRRRLNQALDEIAALPPEGPQDGFSGADHDKVLYGEPDAR